MVLAKARWSLSKPTCAPIGTLTQRRRRPWRGCSERPTSSLPRSQMVIPMMRRTSPHARPGRYAGGDLKVFLRHVEDHAQHLRDRAGVGPADRLDPRALTGELKVRLVSLENIEGLSAKDREHLSSVDPRVWSGAGMPLPDGYTLVILHPGQPPERATVTIMEEVCHAHYRHAPSQLATLPGGIIKREYNPEMETEAYWTAAATLLPAPVVARSVWRRMARSLARDYGVSNELVEFRVKTLGLWREYRRGDVA